MPVVVLVIDDRKSLFKPTLFKNRLFSTTLYGLDPVIVNNFNLFYELPMLTQQLTGRLLYEFDGTGDRFCTTGQIRIDACYLTQTTLTSTTETAVQITPEEITER